jgi:hypothetical protein
MAMLPKAYNAPLPEDDLTRAGRRIEARHHDHGYHGGRGRGRFGVRGRGR